MLAQDGCPLYPVTFRGLDPILVPRMCIRRSGAQFDSSRHAVHRFPAGAGVGPELPRKIISIAEQVDFGSILFSHGQNCQWKMRAVGFA
jgi:hypothetical protein